MADDKNSLMISYLMILISDKRSARVPPRSSSVDCHPNEHSARVWFRLQFKQSKEDVASSKEAAD